MKEENYLEGMEMLLLHICEVELLNIPIFVLLYIGYQ